MSTTLSPSSEVDPRSLLRLCHRSVEFRATEPVTDGRNLTGYAAVFDAPTVIESFGGDFEEEIKRGAFKRSLNARQPVLQFDHGRDKRTGSVPIGAIREIFEDDEGLFVAARLFTNDVVEPVRQAIEGEAIRGMSFRFRVVNDTWIDAEGKKIPDDDLADLLMDPGDRGPIRRQIREVELFELGPVVFPAYDQTSVGVRSMLALFDIDERCARRNLALFSPEDRQVLARELVGILPELERFLEPDMDGGDRGSLQEDADAGNDGESDSVPVPEPANSTSGDQESVGPAERHPTSSAGSPPSWHLPGPDEPVSHAL